MSSATITIPRSQFVELQLFKRLVENNLAESVNSAELELIEEALKEKPMSEAEFLRKAQKLL
jgi:hypothetical protein